MGDLIEFLTSVWVLVGGTKCMGGFPHSLSKGGFPHFRLKGGFPYLLMKGGFPHFEHKGVVCHTYFIYMMVLHTYVCSLSFCLNLGRCSRVSTPSLFVPSSDDTCRRGMNDGVSKWKKVVCFHTYIYGTI